MKVIVVPIWLQKALESKGLSCAAFLSGDVENILSKQDFLFYEHLQVCARRFLSERFKDTFGSYGYRDRNDHERHVIDGFDAICSRYNNEGDSASLSAFMKACFDAFDPSYVHETDMQDKVFGFTLLVEKDDVFFLSPKLVTSGQLLLCYDELFTVLNQKYGMERIAALPLFDEYYIKLAA